MSRLRNMLADAVDWIAVGFWNVAHHLRPMTPVADATCGHVLVPCRRWLRSGFRCRVCGGWWRTCWDAMRESMR